MRIGKTMLLAVLLSTGLASGQAPKHGVSTMSVKKASPTPSTDYYVAVDLGSKGTKATLYFFVSEEEGSKPVDISGKTVNTILVSSMKDGQFTDAGIADAASAVKTVIDAMKDEAKKRGIDVESYYVVGSSGVAKGKNKSDLVQAVKASAGIEMTFVDAPHEGYFGLISSVPPIRRPISMYVDIGSGNTKLGCMIGPSDFKNFKGAEIIYGSVSGRNEAFKRNPDDLNAGMDSVMTDVTHTYEAQSRDIPCLRNRDRIYWTGGAAWATATYAHPESALSGWVVITKRDLDSFLVNLKNGTWNQKKRTVALPNDMPIEKQNAIRARAAEDWNGDHGVMNTFVREDLLSGVSIMEAVLSSSNPSATIRFVRNGGFLYGYALGQLNGDKEKRE